MSLYNKARGKYKYFLNEGNMGLLKDYTFDKAELFRKNSREEINTHLAENQFVNQSLVEETFEKVNTLNFVPHCYKLEKEYGWSNEKINHSVKLYKEWLTLQVHYSNLSFAPSELVDEFWHVHILDTRKYMADCEIINGAFIHHYPYFGLTEQENEDVLESGFQLTKALYKHHFNREYLGYEGQLLASCGCRSGNGGSCR